MAKYIGKRLVTGILSLFVLATVTFFLTRAIPGSPFQGANVSESVLQMMEEEYGLHQPAGVQYVTYMKHLLRGNLGYSYQNPSESVANIIQRSWPVTAVIGVLAILLAMIVGIGIGVWQTFSRHRLLRGGLFTGTLLIGGVPNFVAALLRRFRKLPLRGFPPPSAADWIPGKITFSRYALWRCIPPVRWHG